MRRRIAKRLRKEALRRGVIITNEKMVFSKKELSENKLKRKDNGFSFNAKVDGWNWLVSGKDELDAYRLFLECLNWEEGNEEN